MEDLAYLFEDAINNSILNKANSIMGKMKQIKYGSVYQNGRIAKGDEDEWYEDSNKNCPQKTQDVLKYKIGHCIDQSELERMYFTQENIKHKVFSMFPAKGTNLWNNHVFLVFFDENNKPYWFEHAWGTRRGIHKFDSLEGLFKDVCNKKRTDDPMNYPDNEVEKMKQKFKNIKYEIFEVPAKSGLSWDEYIDWVWKQRLVYKG